MEQQEANDVIERIERLKGRAAWLSERPITEIVGAIAAAAELWSPADSSWRERARQLNSDFPYFMVEPALNRLIDCWTVTRLTRFLNAELGDIALLDGWVRLKDGRRVTACGHRLAAHVLAANTPLLGWESAVASLLTKTPAFLKLSTREAAWAPLFIQSLAETHPELAKCLDYVALSREDETLNRLLGGADWVAVYGGWEAIGAYRAAASKARVFLPFGPRFSVAYIPAEAATPATARKLADDCVRYRQLGCLSPHLVFLEGDPWPFAERLASAIGRRTAEMPMSWGDGEKVKVAQARAAARFESRKQWGSETDPSWSLVLTEEPQWDSTGLYGFTNLVSVGGLEQVRVWLADYGAGLQSIGYAGLRTPELEALARRLRVPRLAPIGAMQTPPFGWFDDGRSLVRSLLIWSEAE